MQATRQTAAGESPAGIMPAGGIPPPDRVYETAKRILDIGVACAALVLLAPVLALAALAIRLTSPGPVLYRGIVHGRDGKPFTYYKLRSMRADGDDAVHRRFIAGYVAAARSAAVGPERSDERTGDVAEGKPVYKLLDDPRITPVGRLLRRTSLDEVPQMINVLRGEMSIVGPRPPVPYEYALYSEYHKQRLAVPPGITGLAQVRARARASFEEMVEIDLEYIRNRSLLGDLAIMARTVAVVVTGDGAH